MEALRPLDLVVERGRIFGILGPNGAGKTTLAKLLLAIAFPSAGSASVLGRRPGDLGALERIGYLPESHRYPPHLTGEQVLHHFGMLSGLRAPERRRRIDGLLRTVRIEAWRDMRVQKYSKGMLQRLGLAQALLNGPDLLLLDEPTDGVDPIGRREIRDILLEQKSRGATIVLNSHLLSEVERVCDRVAILKDGRLVREGSVEDLTRPAGACRIEVSGMRADLLPRLVAIAPVAQVSPGVLDAATADLASINALIDLLRGAGVSIAAVVPRRESLEDVFVKVVGEGETA